MRQLNLKNVSENIYLTRKKCYIMPTVTVNMLVVVLPLTNCSGEI